MATMQIPDDALCPCGSGAEYAQCCKPKEASPGPAVADLSPQDENAEEDAGESVPWLTYGAILAAGLLMGLGAMYLLAPESVPPPPGTTPVQLPPGSPQPPGPAPAGMVWSSEHGHWHQAPATEPPAPGMVWSEEHGHWHNAPEAGATAQPSADAKDSQDGHDSHEGHHH